MLNIIKTFAFFTFFPGLIYGILTFAQSKPTKETLKEKLVFSAFVCLFIGVFYTVYIWI